MFIERGMKSIQQHTLQFVSADNHLAADKQTCLDIYHWLWNGEKHYSYRMPFMSLGPYGGHLTPTSSEQAVVLQNTLNDYGVVITASIGLRYVAKYLSMHTWKWEACENWLPCVICELWTIQSSDPPIWQWCLICEPWAIQSSHPHIWQLAAGSGDAKQSQWL